MNSKNIKYILILSGDIAIVTGSFVSPSLNDQRLMVEKVGQSEVDTAEGSDIEYERLEPSVQTVVDAAIAENQITISLFQNPDAVKRLRGAVTIRKNSTAYRFRTTSIDGGERLFTGSLRMLLLSIGGVLAAMGAWLLARGYSAQMVLLFAPASLLAAMVPEIVAAPALSYIHWVGDVPFALMTSVPFIAGISVNERDVATVVVAIAVFCVSLGVLLLGEDESALNVLIPLTFAGTPGLLIGWKISQQYSVAED
jgi:hypothetical protein